jgi:hypothetical protein
MKIALLLRKLGFTSTIMHGFGLASIGGAVSLWGARRHDPIEMKRREPNGWRHSSASGLRPSFFLARSFRIWRQLRMSRSSKRG